MPGENRDNVFQRKLLSIIILVSLYIFTGIFAENRIINPFDPGSYFDNVEYMVATGASIIFGGMIGAVVGALGFFFLEIILRVIGQETQPLGTVELIITLGLFIGNWVTGYLSRIDHVSKSKFTSVLFNPKSWYNLLINTFSAILGVGIISNIIIGFMTVGTTNDHITVFLTNFYFTFQLIFVFIPVIIIMYNFVEVVRIKRANVLDELYKDLNVEVNCDGPAEIVDVAFQDHALKIGTWTPINLTFKHIWKAGRSYDIETVSTSKVYPHKDTTSVLQQGDKWTHSFYVQALEQDHVDIRVRIHPAHTIKYKQEPKQQTLVAISGKTYIQRDWLLIGVFIFSEVVITLFLFSLLWNQIARIVIEEVFASNTQVGTGIGQVRIPWSLIAVIGVIEAFLFIPFLLIMYRIQKPRVPEHLYDVLAFSQDIQTHKYSGNIDQTSLFKKIRKYVVFPFSNVIFLLLSGFLTYSLLEISGELVQTGTVKLSIIDLSLLIVFTSISWMITLLLLNKTSNRFDTKPSMSIEGGKYIEKVETLSQLKIHTPSEVMFEVRNVSDTPGLRIVFESNDAISPPVLELHIEPGEKAIFKTSLTPATRGIQEILAVIYPLFDKEYNYLPLNDCKPVTSQNIHYKVLGETIIGITETQARTLRHIFGWGSLITSTMALANEYVGVEEAIRQWQETIPFLATIQIPFLYLYYLFSNRFLTNIDAY